MRGRHGDAANLFADAMQHYGKAQKFTPNDPELRDALKRCQAEAARGAKP